MYHCIGKIEHMFFQVLCSNVIAQNQLTCYPKVWWAFLYQGAVSCKLVLKVALVIQVNVQKWPSQDHLS